MPENSLYASGQVIAILQPKKGQSQKGEWVLQEYVIETDAKYPAKICFEVFGQDKISEYDIHIGDIVEVSFNLNSREFNGRWYTSIRAWKVKVRKRGEEAQKQDNAEHTTNDKSDPKSKKATQEEIDDLPF